MIEKQLLKLILNHEFFKANENRILDSMFPDMIGDVYSVVKGMHSKYTHDVEEEMLYELVTAASPTMTTAKKHNLQLIIDEIAATPVPHQDMISDILLGMYRKEMGRQIADEALNLIEGKEAALPALRGLIAKLTTNSPLETEIEEVTAGVEELLELVEGTTKWIFNLTDLNKSVPGIGPGIFTIIGARPEIGKTALWVSLVASPGGFLDQGAKIACFVNEEPAVRTKLRLLSSMTGRTLREIKGTIKRTIEETQLISDNLRIYDAATLTMPQIESYIEEFHPDIVIVDQLDKVRDSGRSTATHEILREIYVKMREVCKRHHVAAIALSQLSADAEGKWDVTLDQFENSRTGKAAEGDVIIGIGGQRSDEKRRQLNVLKNKITGYHTEPIAYLKGQVSRYEN